MDFSVILIIHLEAIFFNSKALILLTYLFTMLYNSKKSVIFLGFGAKYFSAPEKEVNPDGKSIQFFSRPLDAA